VLEEIRARDVFAELDGSEEPEPRLRRRLLVHPRNRLDVRVVGRDARAHEPERRWERVQHVDLEAGGHKLVGGVEAGRAGADDHGAHRARLELEMVMRCLVRS
jgi:hypothetical protein